MATKIRSLPANAVVVITTDARKAVYLSMLVRRQLLTLEAKDDAALDLTVNLKEMQRLITKDGLILLLEALTNGEVISNG